MKTVVYGNKYRACVTTYVSLVFGWAMGTAISMQEELTWRNFTGEFTRFHLIGLTAGTLIGFLLTFDVRHRLKITDHLIVGPKGYAFWNDHKRTTLKIDEGVTVKKGILGGWILPARIIQGKKVIKLYPTYFSPKHVCTVFDEVNRLRIHTRQERA